jgi:group I intron endonuclease
MDNKKIIPITRIMIIYKTTNLINGKIYVGQDSKNDKNYLGSGVILKKAIKKYGLESFKKEVIDIANTKEELDLKEIFWINKLNSTDKFIGYNLSNGGNGCLGCKVSKETRLKMSINNSGSNNPMFGKYLSEKTLINRSIKVKKEGTHRGCENGNFKYDIKYEDLLELYINQNLKIDAIADIYNCHRTVISDNIKKYKINKALSNKYNLEIIEIDKLLSEGLTLVEIGRKYGCSNKIIHKFIKKHKQDGK